MAGQIRLHCSSWSRSIPCTASANVPNALTSGANRARAVSRSTPATSSPHAAIQALTDASSSADATGLPSELCFVGMFVYNILQ